MAQPALESLDDLLGDEANADAVGVEGREDLAAEGSLKLLELRLTELALDGGGDEDEVAALGVRNGLEVAVVDSNSGSAANHDDDEGGARVLVPPRLSAEVQNLGAGGVVVGSPGDDDGGSGGGRGRG